MARKTNKFGNEIVNPSVLSEKQQEAVKAIKQAGGTVEVTKCQYCGKFLIRDISIEQESGDRCYDLHVTKGISSSDLAAIRKSQTLPEVPEGWIKTAVLHHILKKRGIPVNRMVKAFGGDRGDGPLMDPKCEFKFVGNARYVSGWCATEEYFKMLMGNSKAPVAEAPKKVVKATEAAKKVAPEVNSPAIPDLSAI